MPEEVATFFITQGVLGVSVVILAAVVLKLYTQNQKLNAQLVELAKENGKEMIEFYQNDAESQARKAEAITGMAHSIDLLTAKINQGAKS